MPYVRDITDVYEFVSEYVEFLMSIKGLYKYKTFLLKRAYDDVYAYYKGRDSMLKSTSEDDLRVLITTLYHKLILPLVKKTNEDVSKDVSNVQQQVENKKSKEINKIIQNKLQLKAACNVAYVYIKQNISDMYLLDFMNKSFASKEGVMNINKEVLNKCRNMVMSKVQDEVKKYLSNNAKTTSLLKDLSEKQLISFTKKEIKNVAIPYLKNNLML